MAGGVKKRPGRPEGLSIGPSGILQRLLFLPGFFQGSWLPGHRHPAPRDQLIRVSACLGIGRARIKAGHAGLGLVGEVLEHPCVGIVIGRVVPCTEVRDWHGDTRSWFARARHRSGSGRQGPLAAVWPGQSRQSLGRPLPLAAWRADFVRRPLRRTITLPSYGRISGLAPAPIDYRYMDTYTVTIETGTGGAAVKVPATGPPTNLTGHSASTTSGNGR